MHTITGYELRVTRGVRAGLVKFYNAGQRASARRFADTLDNQYGAICCSVRPILSPAKVAGEGSDDAHPV